MDTAQQIVDVLLEAEGETFDPREYLNQFPSGGAVNAETAMTASRFYHRKLKYKGTDRPIEVRRMGNTKRWKRDPERFRVPVKYGMYDSFYIDNDNAHEWSVDPPQ